jgi:Protein of unknown function (DUF3716)
MPPTPENSFATLPDSLPQHAPNEFTSSSPVTALYATSPAGSAHNSASKTRKPGAVDALETLRALPEVRPIPWQAGKELPPEKSIESPRSQTRGAFLLSTRGQIRNPPCTHCATGVGRFSVCVSLEGWFHSACATCQMGTRGNLCSLRKDAEGGLRRPFLISLLTKEAEGVMVKVNPSKLGQPYITQSPPLADSDLPSSSLKRKRESPSTIAAAAQSLMNSTSPQTQTTLPASSNPINSYSIPPNNLPHNDAVAPVNYIYQKQSPPNGTKRDQNLYSAQSDPREAGNRPTPPPNNTYRTVGIGKGSKREPNRDGTDSLSPSSQLIQPIQTSYENLNRNMTMAAQPEARNVGHPATPLIDTLPRKKQKQIYQIIGGVQSGIRSVRQQTESLQKQLDLLQTVLGIDTGDEDDDYLI